MKPSVLNWLNNGLQPLVLERLTSEEAYVDIPVPEGLRVINREIIHGYSLITHFIDFSLLLV